MLTPLYDITTLTAPVTVAAPGAAVNDVTVPVVALTASMPVATILDFGGSKFAKLLAPATAGDAAVSVAALAKALNAGDVATFPLPSANPLLSATYTKLDTATRLAQHVLAEMVLGLVAPAYDGDDALELAFAVVLQINFQLLHGITPDLVRSRSNTRTGDTVTYRDRYVDPEARRIVERVTGVVTVGFEPFGAGV